MTEFAGIPVVINPALKGDEWFFSNRIGYDLHVATTSGTTIFRDYFFPGRVVRREFQPDRAP